MATARILASSYYLSSSTYLTVSSADNMYTNTDSTTYATVTNTQSGTSSYYIYIRGFDFSSIPSTANVTSFTVKFKARESGVNTGSSYVPMLCNNTTTITGTCTALGTTAEVKSFTGVTATWDTIKGYGDNGENFGIRINCRRAARNTTGYVYIYGAEIEVTYTVPVYHNVTSSTEAGTIVPSGVTSVLEGSSYTLTISGIVPKVMDNGIDVTSQLVESSSGSTVMTPYNYSISTFTASDIANAYSDVSSTTRATLSLAGGNKTGTIYLDLSGLTIPSDATINSVTAKAKLQFSRNNSSSGVTASCRMYSGSTAKGSATTIVSSATDVATTTFDLTPGTWTASEVANARFYLTMTNNASSTVRYMYIYGVSFTVSYTVDDVFYIYTISSVNTAHTITVSLAVVPETIFRKVGAVWTQLDYANVYKKVNGSWVLQESPSDAFDSDVNYVWSS